MQGSSSARLKGIREEIAHIKKELKTVSPAVKKVGRGSSILANMLTNAFFRLKPSILL
jgi:hypothetical protein